MLGFHPLASAPLGALDANFIEASASGVLTLDTWHHIAVFKNH